MTINGYIKANSDKSYLELPFNYVDGLIFSELAYINFDLLLKHRDEFTFKEITDEEINDDLFEGSVDASKNETMFNLMRKSVRYQDIIVKNVKRTFSTRETIQFLAMTLVLPDGTLFLSYRGTDTTLIGWKEDAFISFKDTIKAQEEALEYAREALRYKDTKFILGGHSKGGNLAFYTALNLPKEKTPKLIKAYSYDGPGFKDGITKFPSYKYVRKKLIKFRTYNNVIGSIFNNMRVYKVVHSTGLLFGGHDPFYWQIKSKTNDFKYAEDISKTSKKYSKRVMKWMESLTYEDRELIVNALFDVFKGNKTIYDLFKNFLKNIARMNKTLTKYTKEERSRLRAMIKRLMGFVINSSKVKYIKRKEAILDRELKTSSK